MIRITLTAALVLLPVAGPLAAQELPGEALAIIDTSGDGILARDEIDAFVVAIAAAMDANEDGSIDAAEAAAALSAEQIAAVDSNGDGILSPEELAVVVRADFAAADTDGNGLID